MKQSTLYLRNRFNLKKTTRRFKNWKQIQRWVYQANLCAFCRKPLHGEIHIDHIRPISHSTSNRINQYSNLVISCPTCNKMKSDKTGVQYPEWVKRRKDKYARADYKTLLQISEEAKRGFSRN